MHNTMRNIFKFIVLCFVIFSPSLSSAATLMNGEGMHTETWFHASSGDLNKDLAAAQAEGKNLAIFWEQEGCSYCKKMHELNLQIPEVRDFIKPNFYAVLLNMRGDKAIVDFDGTPVTEQQLAEIHRITGTPTIDFWQPGNPPHKSFRMPGYAQPHLFKGIFEYVASEGYKNASLSDWYKAKYAPK